MGSLMWRIKESLRNLMPWVVAGLVAWGGYSLYKKGAFRHGVPTLGQALSYLPHFGTRFKQYSGRKYHSYAPAKKQGRKKYTSRRHHGRRRR